MGGVVLLCGWPVTGLPAAMDEKAAPRIEIQDPVQQGETVLEGQLLSGRFVLANTGRAVLHIKEIKAGCPCMHVEGPSQLEPGAKGELQLRIDTKEMPGERAFKVHVASDDPEQPVVIAVLKATISPLVTLTPDRFFLRGPVGQSLTAVIDIVNRGNDALALSLDSPPANENLTIQLITVTDGKQFRLLLHCSGKGGPSIRERLILRTNIPNREVIAVPVLIDLQPPVELLPTTLELQAERCPACSSRFSGSFVLRSTNGRPLTLLAIAPEQPGLHYQIETLLPQQAYRVRVHWEEAKANQGLPPALTLTVYQDAPQTLTLPLRITTTGKGVGRPTASDGGD